MLNGIKDSSKIKHIEWYLYQLVLDGKRSLDELDEYQKEVLSSLLIDSSDTMTAFEYITEADKNENLPYMLSTYMKKRDPESAQTLLDYMVENAVKYSSNDIVDILEKQIEEYNYDMKYDNEC